MQSDKRKQLILRAIPERKKTSKKLKEKVLEQIYFRSSSLPQKKYTQPKQKEHSFTRRHQDLRGQSSQFSYKQRHSSQAKSSIQKIDQTQQFIPHRSIQRKNRSLPKYLYSEPNNSHNESQFQLESFKNTDQYRTKVKKLSQKDDMLHQSQEKHRLQTLEEILKKKNSQRLIRDNFLSTNMRNSPMDNSHPQKPKNKQSKMIGLKYAFQNRKFTNLSKYKSSMGARNNPFSSGKMDYERQPNTNLSRKVSKQNSKTRIKTTQEDNFYDEDNVKEEKDLSKFNEVKIKDLDLMEYIDSENVMKKDLNSKIVTLQDIFNQANQHFKAYIKSKSKQAENETKDSKQTKDNNLQKGLKLLKTIQKQTGSLSRKTVLLLGLANFYSHDFSNCIFYLQNVFREVNYNLSLIDSLKAWIHPDEMIKFCSEVFIVLAESYKKTQNFLCSIKVLDQWEKNIVQKFLQDHQNNQPRQVCIEKKKRTISHLSSYENEQKDRKFSKNTNSNHDYESVTLEDELNPKKKSYSLLRQNSQGNMKKGCFSYTVKEKQRTQSLVKKDSIKFQTQQLNIKPRSKHLSIKTLSDINLNLNQQSNNVDEQELKMLPQKQREIFASGYLMRARIQFEIKNFYASIQDYNRTLACSQQNLQPGLELATLYYKIGRKDKCISFLQQFLEQISQSTSFRFKKHQSIKQIKYHLAVMLYKCAKYNESLKVLDSIQKQHKAQGLEGQISFYTALNMIKLKKVFDFQKDLNEQESNNVIEDILIKLQQSIDLGCSKFYIYAAYFLRIYLLLFKVKHYYGAQYEIDRMMESIERKKYGLIGKSLERQSISLAKQKIDYGQISIQPFSHIINLQDLIQLTSAIICILKLKLTKGLKLISQIQRKVKESRKLILSTNVISIQPHLSCDVNQAQNDMHSSEILKLIYEFKYYGLFTMRQYQKAVRCLEKIRIIDGMSKEKQLEERRQKQQLEQKQQQLQIPPSQYEIFKSDSDKLNYLNLRSLILIQEKKFHQALKMLKLIQSQSSTKQKNHKRTKSGNLDTISTVIEYKKDENMFHIIKALCYILLYKYLQDQKTQNSVKNQLDQIKIQEVKDSCRQQDQDHQPASQNNQQILLVAQDLLSQCLVCDKQNFQILYLIAVIHYELCRYQSALNYIRQAIQLSDDHMIKHYYLKANMKLMLGKYDEAIKDYSNAITVYKEFEKDKREGDRAQEVYHHKSEMVSGEAEYGESTEVNNPAYNTFNNNQSSLLTTRTQHSKDHANQYYEQNQQMHLQIYLNRAIAYLKYAYSMQFETCRNLKLKMEEQSAVRYSDVRQNIINMKTTAAQDINYYFAQKIKHMKKQYHSIHNPKHPSNHSTITHNKSQSPNKPCDVKPSNHSNLQAFVQNTMKLAPYVQLLLHTSDVEPMLEISRTFVKEFDIKLISDEELLVYFYIAKELNNCLLLMEKIIKKYYLSQKNKRESKSNNGKKQITSKNQTQCEPYFKSKKDHKMQRTSNYQQFNSQKYTPKTIPNHKGQSQSNLLSLQHPSHSQHQKIQKLIFDKKVLSALKDSSSNSREDYQNALVTLLEENQNIRKSSSDEENYQGGTIFTYSDLLFFIGVLYYLLEDYDSAIKYFVSSYSIKKKQGQLYSLKTIVTTTYSPSYQDSSSESDKWHGQKLQISNLKSFDEIYDNRIYSKQQIQYNIGVAYLMAQDYNTAYDYLEKYETFVEIIENVLTQNESNLDDKKTKNKLKKMKKTLSDSERQDDLSFDQVSVKTKTNKQDEFDSDVTPFPTHNRLCSIYPQKQINGKSFFLSFCLPKIELPTLGLFSYDQIEMANLYIPSPQDKKLSKNPLFNLNDTKQNQSKLGKNKSPSKAQTLSKSFVNSTQKFLLQKEGVMNFLDVVSLKDIEMKPIAPWIKKDKQKKCIRFTENFLAESYDLKTQTTTQRKHRNSSKKDMFGESGSQAFNKKPKEKNQVINDRKQIPDIIENDERQKINVAKLLKKSKAEQYNFMKQKEKQKPGQNRYETIQHD